MGEHLEVVFFGVDDVLAMEGHGAEVSVVGHQEGVQFLQTVQVLAHLHLVAQETQFA